MLFSDLIDYLKNEKTFNIILNCSTDLHEIRDVEPVSYTHLDVYKRQAYLMGLPPTGLYTLCWTHSLTPMWST